MGLILDHIKTFLRDLILPPCGPLLLAIAGALWLRTRPRLGGTLLALGLAAMWLLSLPIVADVLAIAAQHYGALDLDKPVRAQAVVILGGGGQRDYAPEYRGPAPEPYLLDRLAYGAYVARATHLPILVTGFRIEGLAMRDSLERNFGLEVRWVDRNSYDTFDNARNSARLLHEAGIKQVVLVTSVLHMWRAAHEFTAAGLEVVPAPTEVKIPHLGHLNAYYFTPDSFAVLRSSTVLYEVLGERVREFFAFTGLRRQHPLD